MVKNDLALGGVSAKMKTSKLWLEADLKRAGPLDGHTIAGTVLLPGDKQQLEMPVDSARHHTQGG